MATGAIEPERMAAELARAPADRGLVPVSAAYLEELEDTADSAAIDARADERTFPFRFEDYV